LDRNKAVAVYKQIMKISDSMVTNAFNLKESGDNDYQINIRIAHYTDVIKEISEIAKNNKLSIKEENGEIILYTPK
jgi:hypothetical protein